MIAFEHALAAEDRTFDVKAWADSLDSANKSAVLSDAAERAAGLCGRHSDWDTIAGNLMRELNRLNAYDTFADFVIGTDHMSDLMKSIVGEHGDEIQGVIDEFEGQFSYMAWKTLNRSYLFPKSTPEYMFMRVALGLHGTDLAAAFESYRGMIHGIFTHATPTLFASGTKHPQLASCFLIQCAADSIDGIFKTITDLSLIHI